MRFGLSVKERLRAQIVRPFGERSRVGKELVEDPDQGRNSDSLLICFSVLLFSFIVEEAYTEGRLDANV